MKIANVFGLCTVVGIVLIYGLFLTKWAGEDKTQKQNQKEKKLQKLPY